MYIHSFRDGSVISGQGGYGLTLVTMKHIQILFAQQWLIHIFVLIITALSALAAEDTYLSEQLSKPNLKIQERFLKLNTPNLKTTYSGFSFCGDSQEENFICCVHCCCQIYLLAGIPVFWNTRDGFSKLKNGFIDSGLKIISVPYRPPKAPLII